MAAEIRLNNLAAITGSLEHFHAGPHQRAGLHGISHITTSVVFGVAEGNSELARDSFSTASPNLIPGSMSLARKKAASEKFSVGRTLGMHCLKQTRAFVSGIPH